MSKERTASDVFWYWPNIIGYTRIILSIISFFVYEKPMLFWILYSTSFLLDAADGHVARMFHQCIFFLFSFYSIYFLFLFYFIFLFLFFLFFSFIFFIFFHIFFHIFSFFFIFFYI